MNIKNMRTKVVFSNCFKILRNRPRLLFFSSISTTINILFLIAVGHPIYLYGKIHLQAHTSPSPSFIVMFYLIFLSYLYCKNVIHAWLENASIYLITNELIEKKTISLGQAFQHANRNFFCSLRTITFTSIFGFWIAISQNFFKKIGLFNKLLGKGSWFMAAYFLAVITATQKLPVKTALNTSTQLFLNTWGNAPIISNLSIFNMQFKYFIPAIIPILVTIPFHNTLAFDIAGLIAVAYYLIASFFFRTIHQLIKISLYHYSSCNQTILPMSGDIAQHAFTQYVPPQQYNPKEND